MLRSPSRAAAPVRLQPPCRPRKGVDSRSRARSAQRRSRGRARRRRGVQEQRASACAGVSRCGARPRAPPALAWLACSGRSSASAAANSFAPQCTGPRRSAAAGAAAEHHLPPDHFPPAAEPQPPQPLAPPNPPARHGRRAARAAEEDQDPAGPRPLLVLQAARRRRRVARPRAAAAHAHADRRVSGAWGCLGLHVAWSCMRLQWAAWSCLGRMCTHGAAVACMRSRLQPQVRNVTCARAQAHDTYTHDTRTRNTLAGGTTYSTMSRAQSSATARGSSRQRACLTKRSLRSMRTGRAASAWGSSASCAASGECALPCMQRGVAACSGPAFYAHGESCFGAGPNCKLCGKR